MALFLTFSEKFITAPTRKPLYPYEKKNVPAKQENGKNVFEEGLCCKVLVKSLNRSALTLTVESAKEM